MAPAIIYRLPDYTRWVSPHVTRLPRLSLFYAGLEKVVSMAYREGLSVRLFFHLYLCLEAGVSGESGEIRHRSTMVGDGSADCDLRSPKSRACRVSNGGSGLRRPVIVAPDQNYMLIILIFYTECFP